MFFVTSETFFYSLPIQQAQAQEVAWQLVREQIVQSGQIDNNPGIFKQVTILNERGGRRQKRKRGWEKKNTL